MTRAASELLIEALKLSVNERAKFAADLLDSLPDAEHDVEAVSATEIQERVAAARAGELQGTEWRTVLDRVESEVLGR
jgi:putative addiction module component (TIGR02574 family)